MLTSLRKSDLLVLAIAAAALATIWISSRLAITSEFDKLDRKLLQAEASRIDQAVKGLQSSLQSKLEDWGTWDESYLYVTKDNTNFEQTNLTPAAFTALKINGAMFLNDDLSTKSAFLKQTDSESIERHPEVNLHDTGFSKEAASAASTSSQSSFISFVGNPAIAVMRGVLKGDGTGAARGRLIFIRTIDRSFLQTLSDQTLHRIELENGAWSGPSAREDALIRIPRGRILVGEESATIEQELTTKEGQRIGTLTASLSREIMINGRATVFRFTLVFSSLSFGALFASALAMPYFRTSRALRKLSADHKTLTGRENQLRALFDSVPGQVVWFDVNLDILGSNEAFSAGRSLRGDLRRLSDQDPLELHVMGAAREIFKAESPSSESILELPDERRLLVRARRVQNTEAIIAIATDITAAWQAQQEVIRSRELLVHAVRQSSIANLASGVAHEINNPLAIIMGKSEKIVRILDREQETLDRTSLMRDLEVIQRASSRVAKIAWSLADISRDTSNDPLQTASIEELVATAMMSFSARMASEKVSLSLRGDSSTAFVRCQRTAIIQSFLSLIANAVEAVAEAQEKWIVIGCEARGEVIQISFTDSGSGIPEEHKPKLMQPFFSTKKAGKGAGLSLSVAKKFVEASGGRLFLDESSTHTTFVIELHRAAVTLQIAS